MINDLMIDEERQRFESQEFPESITPHYLGKMTEGCSLGRIAMGFSPPNLPMKLKSLSSENLLYGQQGDPQLAGAILGHTLIMEYDLEVDISALRMNFLFFDAFGKTIGEHFYSFVQDIPKGSWKNQDSFYYDNAITKNFFDKVIIQGMSSKSFNLCLFGISAVRTTDGLLLEHNTEDFIAMTEWAFPSK